MPPIRVERVRVVQGKGHERLVTIGDRAAPFRYGSHTEPEAAPSALDHFVAATAGCLVGTLAMALEARRVPTAPDVLWVEAEGTIERVEGVLKFTRIHTVIHLTVPADQRAAAERALAVFERGCPIAQTLAGCMTLTHEVVLTSG